MNKKIGAGFLVLSLLIPIHELYAIRRSTMQKVHWIAGAAGFLITNALLKQYVVHRKYQLNDLDKRLAEQGMKNADLLKHIFFLSHQTFIGKTIANYPPNQEIWQLNAQYAQNYSSSSSSSEPRPTFDYPSIDKIREWERLYQPLWDQEYTGIFNHHYERLNSLNVLESMALPFSCIGGLCCAAISVLVDKCFIQTAEDALEKALRLMYQITVSCPQVRIASEMTSNTLSTISHKQLLDQWRAVTTAQKNMVQIFDLLALAHAQAIEDLPFQQLCDDADEKAFSLSKAITHSAHAINKELVHRAHVAVA